MWLFHSKNLKHTDAKLKKPVWALCKWLRRPYNVSMQTLATHLPVENRWLENSISRIDKQKGTERSYKAVHVEYH